jgi:hypothetical protein
MEANPVMWARIRPQDFAFTSIISISSSSAPPSSPPSRIALLLFSEQQMLFVRYARRICKTACQKILCAKAAMIHW